jgi:hypothetical protein
VITAVLTSQVAGTWLRFVLKKGWPLLSSHPEETGLAQRTPAPANAPGWIGVRTPGIEATQRSS